MAVQVIDVQVHSKLMTEISGHFICRRPHGGEVSLNGFSVHSNDV